MKRVVAAAVLLAGAQASAQVPAADDPLAYLGWLRELAGACWQGRDAYGVTREVREGDGWKVLQRVEYRRVQ